VKEKLPFILLLVLLILMVWSYGYVPFAAVGTAYWLGLVDMGALILRNLGESNNE